MTAASFFGNALTAYGPALAVFLLYIAKSAQLVILAMTSAFFWLLSILASSIIWYILQKHYAMQAITWATIIFSVALQEGGRYLFYRLLRRAEDGLNGVSSNPRSPLNWPNHAFVSGMGFGMMSGVTSYIRSLAESSGPGVMQCESCPSADVFFIGAITTCLFTFLHATWTMVAFEGWKKRDWVAPSLVIVTHYVASFSTLLIPSSIRYGCVYSIATCLVILLCMTGLVGQSISKIRVA